MSRNLHQVVGIDEVGRGSLGGPVVACAVMAKLSFSIRDSKKLSPKKRDEFYNVLTKHPAVKWGIGRVSEKVIDRINILEATKLAMKRAVQNLEPKLMGVGNPLKYRGFRHPKMDFLVIDGNFKINVDIPQKSIVKADEKVFSCAAASIIAKITRDRMMQRYHKKYPQYGFNWHKGYPTEFHYQMLKKYGPCQIHRKSFRL